MTDDQDDEPRNKAEWLMVNYPEGVTFPLDGDVVGGIPPELPGDVPESLVELYDLLPED